MDLELEGFSSRKRGKMVKQLPEGTTELTLSTHKATANYWGYMTMLKTAMGGNPRFSVESVVNDWWYSTFPSVLLTEMSLLDVTLKIQYRLLYLGYIEFGVRMKKKFMQNYKYFVQGIGEEFDQDEEYYRLLDNLQRLREIKIKKQEGVMAKTAAKPAAKTTAAAKTVAPEKATAKKVAPVKEATKVRDAVCALIVERKYTDEAIMDKTGANEVTVKKMYRRLNTGTRKGFEMPKTPYVPLDSKGNPILTKKEEKVAAKAALKAEPKAEAKAAPKKTIAKRK